MTAGELTYRYANGEARRERIVAFIREFMQEHHYSPNVREIMAGCGLSAPSTAHSHLAILEKDRRLTRDPFIARSIRLIGACPTCGCEGHGP